MIDQKSLRAFASAIGLGGDEQPTITTGTVVSTGSSGVWVRFDGASEPTPVQASSAAVSPGDSVSVTVQDGTATITGNLSRPATDDMRANEAHRVAVRADEKADDAVEIARNGSRYTALTEEGVVVGKLENGVPTGGYTAVSDDSFAVKSANGSMVAQLSRRLLALLGGVFRMKTSGSSFDYDCEIGTAVDNVFQNCRTVYSSRYDDSSFTVKSMTSQLLDHIISTASSVTNVWAGIDEIFAKSELSASAGTPGSTKTASVTANAVCDAGDNASTNVDMVADSITVSGNPMFATANVTSSSQSIAANSYKGYTANFTAPSGYTCVGCTQWQTNHNYTTTINDVYVANGTVNSAVHNFSSSAQSTTVIWTLLFIRNELASMASSAEVLQE